MSAGVAAAPALPPRRRTRALLAWLHLWVGMTVGTVFAVIGLSGSALVFHDELLRWRHPQLAAGAPQADPAVLARIVDRGRGDGLRSVQFPDAAMPSWIGFHEDGRRVHYATGDGRVLLERRPGDDALLWLHELHTHLLGGERGEQVLGVLGVVSLALVLVGLYLWWPMRGRWLAQLRVHRGPPIRRWLTWHRSSGVLLLPLLLLSTLTGLGMVYHDAARALLTAMLGGGAAQAPTPAPAPATRVRWDRVLVLAGGASGTARLTRVAVPAPDAGTVDFRARHPAEWHPNGRSTLAIDAAGTRVLRVVDASAEPLGVRATNAIYPLHIGVAGGATLRWLTFVAGLLPAFLLVTGVLFWLRRRAAGRRPRPARA
ncbi:MAG TPA: PepSY-associated TM helix domain-containing protein [Lysobacter sp.]